MIPYRWIRPLLFTLPCEAAHRLVMQILYHTHQLKLLKKPSFSNTLIDVFGLQFQHPVGLAAGFDKNGDAIDALGQLGFSFIEVGTVTPRPQAGNPKPRLFRLPQQHALINRMGFNNKGAHYLKNRLKQRKYTGIVGVNIGKNKETPLEKAHEDYLFCLETLAPYADYITVNLSSPNTPQLRELQRPERLAALLKCLTEKRAQLVEQCAHPIPLLIKLDPDMRLEDTDSICEVLDQSNIDGLILTNTTIQRPEGIKTPHAKEAGGLSGAPLREASTKALAHYKATLSNRFPLIGVGGILSVEDALKKKHAGACLVQLYTGLIYQGPGLISSIARHWKAEG